MSSRVLVGILVTIFSAAVLTGCGSSSSNSSSSTPPAGAAETVSITATNGTTQSSAGGKMFSAPLSVSVTTNGVRTSGEKVTFTAPASGASGTFANGTATDVEITNSVGTATSSAFTANTAGGSYAVMASVSGTSTNASFNLTNIPVTSFSFYVSGMETETFSLYGLAGSISLDSSGNVLGGEQDYNDGFQSFFSPEPGGDTITGGSLTFPAGAPAGQGVLTINTNNLTLGLNSDGVEVFAVQFVNANHALIMQYDGFDVSSGSLDLQTLPSTPSGGYAFEIAGLDNAEAPVSFGGVFSVNGASVTNGKLDINDAFNFGVTTGTSFSGTISAPDSYGRGTLTGISVAGSKVTLVYYAVGPEVLRLVDVDAFDAGIGSAFGQGTGTFSNTSLGSAVIALTGTPNYPHFGALGQFSTSDTTSLPSNFSGVGDDNELDNGILSSSTSKFSGTYSIGGNGYGSLSVTNGGLGDVTTLGVYMTDPALNLSDPNNPAGGGGALMVDLDTALPGGVGVVVPQTDTSTADFAGNYAAGWQNISENCGDCEFDMLAQGTMVAGGDLSLTGMVSDPLFSLGLADSLTTGDTFTAIPTPDAVHPGRYTMLTKKESVAAVVDGTPVVPNFYMVLYQASAGQLFWLDYDTNLVTVSLGPLEQQGDLTGIPAARGGVLRNSVRSGRRQK
jgi:hypothetical protein